MREFIQILTDTCNTLNQELYNKYEKVDSKQYEAEKEKLDKQTHCFVCNEEFEEIHTKIKQKKLLKESLKKFS